MAGLMPEEYQIGGSSRRDLTDQQFRDLARQAVPEFGTGQPEGEVRQAFQDRLSFASIGAGARPLAAAIERAERDIGGASGRLLHLAVPPAAFEPTVAMLGAAGLAAGSRGASAGRILAGLPIPLGRVTLSVKAMARLR
jgi:glucose-6-phosphate 1-dehydrogenase